MRHAKKPAHILDLEKTERKFLTVSEAVPELTIIAREEKKNLNNTRDFQFCVDIMDRRNLNR